MKSSGNVNIVNHNVIINMTWHFLKRGVYFKGILFLKLWDIVLLNNAFLVKIVQYGIPHEYCKNKLQKTKS